MRSKPQRMQNQQRCVLCKQSISADLYAFGGPCTYACESCLRLYYESQDKELWQSPREFDRFFRQELRERAAWAQENLDFCRIIHGMTRSRFESLYGRTA